MIIEFIALAQLDKEDDAHVVVPPLADDQGVLDFAEGLDHPVDLGGADAHAAGVEGGVGAAVDDDAAARGDLDEIAVPPHPLEVVEVGLAILFAVRIVPEAHRHGGEGTGADQLPLLADQRFALVRPGLDLHAEAALLDFAGVNRAGRLAEHEAGDDVGAAADRGELQVALHAGVNPLEVPARQG